MQALDGLGSGSDFITGEGAVSFCLTSVSGVKSGLGEILPMVVRGEDITGELEPELLGVPVWECLGMSKGPWVILNGPCSGESEYSSHWLSSLTSSSSSL